jgi:hypothetical protein
MDLDQADPSQLVNPAASPGRFAEKPLSFLYSQIYPSTLEVSLQFSPFSLFLAQNLFKSLQIGPYTFPKP